MSVSVSSLYVFGISQQYWSKAIKHLSNSYLRRNQLKKKRIYYDVYNKSKIDK